MLNPVFRRLLPLALFLALAQNCTNVRSQGNALFLPPYLDNPHLRTLLEEFDHFMADTLARAGVPGAAVVVVYDTAVVFQRGYGLRRLGMADSVDAHTVFRLGSLSKGFTGVLAGLLVHEECLCWDDCIRNYVPEFSLTPATYASQVQLTHLLAHTTGLPYHAYTNLIEAGYDLRTIAQRFANFRVKHPPGEVYAYQNAAFALAGEAMQAVTGKTFGELLKERIFKPAGMRSASADQRSMLSHPNIAWPHEYTRTGWRAVPITSRYYNAAPAGGVNASAADMGQWLLVLLGNRPDIVPAEVLDEVFRPRVRTDGERRYSHLWGQHMTPYYGLGWRTLVGETDTLVYHGGLVNNFRSEIALDRRNRIGICVLFNAPAPVAGTIVPAFWHMYRERQEDIRTWKATTMRP
ncbi:MAG: serine hydrolase domain-containing protein [Saprospiraceae bacterium]|nr:beta-lactamase family protein [Saprospiraceae bacterium]MDW8230479.1 serine hydrolase domain-containing protein [Saprospiraceae bacterium]